MVGVPGFQEQAATAYIPQTSGVYAGQIIDHQAQNDRMKAQAPWPVTLHMS